MTKLRSPHSVEEAISRTLGLLLDEGVAEATGKSASMVRKWGDPDDDIHRIPLHHAISLDAACVKAGYEPFICVAAQMEVARQVAAQGGGTNHTPHDPFSRLAELLQRLGDVSGEIRRSMSPESDGGTAITPNERAQIRALIMKAQDCISLLSHDVESLS